MVERGGGQKVGGGGGAERARRARRGAAFHSRRAAADVDDAGECPRRGRARPNLARVARAPSRPSPRHGSGQSARVPLTPAATRFVARTRPMGATTACHGGCKKNLVDLTGQRRHDITRHCTVSVCSLATPVIPTRQRKTAHKDPLGTYKNGNGRALQLVDNRWRHRRGRFVSSAHERGIQTVAAKRVDRQDAITGRDSAHAAGAAGRLRPERVEA